MTDTPRSTAAPGESGPGLPAVQPAVQPGIPPATPPLRIAIVGAECTGKSTLAAALAAALAAPPPAAVAAQRSASFPARPAAAAGSAAGSAPRVALVGEVLREWCAARGRTPRPDEQAAILAEQHRRIDAAAAAHEIVVADTTGLMTHVYSAYLFGDESLGDEAVKRHRAMTVTLLTALDLPWQADGHQRDGEHVRRPVDDLLRSLLARHGLPFTVVAGRGPTRLALALAAVRPHWPQAGMRGMAGMADAEAAKAAAAAPDVPAADRAAAARPGAGRFTRLLAAAHDAEVRAAIETPSAWLCECCVPGAEQALVRP